MSQVNTIIDHIEPEFEKALIADVKYGKKLIQVLRELNKKWTDLLSPNTKDSESTCTKEYYESVRVAVTKGWPVADRTLWELLQRNWIKSKRTVKGNSAWQSAVRSRILGSN